MQELFSFEADVPMHIFQYGLPSSRGEQHWHSFYEIGYCIQGEALFHIGEHTVGVKAGDLVWFPPFTPHIAHSESEATCSFIFIYFSAELLPSEDRLLLHAFSGQGDVKAEQHLQACFPGDVLRDKFSGLLSEYQWKKPAYGSLLRGSMLELMSLLYRLEERGRPKEERLSLIRGLERIRPALDCIHARFSEPIGLSDLAAAAALSPSRTRHLFKETVGKGFKSYLAFVRIQEAKRLLTQTELSVTEIYLACGYDSSAPFYRAFHTLVGQSPLEYRMGQKRQ
ncbi:AraC family transcriptional regulator [Paenibacillus gansuensis]|uniref:AraC family transcriptional regulator n=1 Tax=Paenibacillus gansuensis TaxID=306542 RepID=A0ABW5PG43_9BACL